jgi:hypothetical protein
MKPFSLRLREYLKGNNISQYRFASAISQESKHNFKCTLRKVHRWTKEHEPRISTFEGAHVLKIIQDWEETQGLPPQEIGSKSSTQAGDERNRILGFSKDKMKALSFFERQEIIDTFCNSGRSFSSVLNPSQEKIIRWYFGLNKSRKKLTLVAIANKFQISSPVVYSILFVSLFKLKNPHLPVGKIFQGKTFQKGRIILDDFFKRGLFLSALLNKKQEIFIRLRYGLDGRKPLTLQAIGDRYGVTREFIRKTNLRSLQKLK